MSHKNDHVPLTVRLPKALDECIRMRAAAEDRTMSAVVRRLLEDALEQEMSEAGLRQVRALAGGAD